MKKTITIKYGQMPGIVKWFSNEEGFYRTAVLPVKVRRLFKNIAKKIEAVYREYTEDFEETFDKYRSDEYSVVTDGNLGVRKVKAEHLQDYQRELAEFYDIDAEVEIVPIDLPDVQSLDISPADYDVLELFLSSEG